MSQFSKVTHSRHQWKGKANSAAMNNRYLRKQLARVKAERDKAKRALKRPKCACASWKAKCRPWPGGPRSMAFGSPCGSF